MYEVRACVDREGFDYFFRYYISPSELPEEIQSAARKYIRAAEELEGLIEEE
jgi:hypothetical protein